MLVRRLVVPVAAALALLGLPHVTPEAAAAATPVTVKVVGAQTYGGQPAFSGSTGVAGLTVTGVTCTGLSNGEAIAPTLPALGSYTIAGATCSGGQLSNPDYVIAGYTGATHTVFRAPLTVTAESKAKDYGDANPALTYAVSGFVNGQDGSVLTGSPVLSTTATASSGVGTYPISITKGTLAAPSNNYALNNFVAGTLTVKPKQLTVAVTGAQEYGIAPIFSASSGVAGVTVKNVTCTGLTGGQDIDVTLPVGSYTIDGATCSGGTPSSPNYAVGSYQGGKFNVLRAALVVTATDASREYNRSNPAFEYTITGFRNGEDASVVTGAPSLSTTAITSSDVGSYPITPSAGTLAAGNYRFIFVPGTLTIEPRQLTIGVTGAQNYGEQPAFVADTGRPGVTATGVTCTELADGTDIGPTLAVGSYAIDPATCSGGQLSNTNYAIRDYASQGFVVFKSPLTVTASDASREYNRANPAFGYTITGFKNDEDASVVTGAPALSTTAITSSDVGTYPITPSAGTLAAANYRFVFAPGTLTVTPRAVNVTVTGAQNYGGSPAFSATTTAAGVTVSGVSCTALTGGQAIAPTLPVASGYTIDPASCSGGVLSNANYEIGAYKPAAFLVFKAPLTVTADDISRTYGFGNPALTYSFSGFQNDDDGSDLTGTPSLTTTADVKSNAGTYPIDIAVGTLSSTNYKLVLKPGTFTVTKRQLTVAANPATRGYGAAAPAYTASYTGFRNGDTASVLSGSPAFSTTATTSSLPGSYPLDVAQGTLEATNYTFGGFTSSTLTITQGTADIATTKMSNSTVSAVVTFGVDHTPVVGSTITFTVGKTDNLICTAVTDSTGKAACTVPNGVKIGVQLNGFTARFPGTAALLPAEKHQGIL